LSVTHAPLPPARTHLRYRTPGQRPARRV